MTIQELLTTNLEQTEQALKDATFKKYQAIDKVSSAQKELEECDKEIAGLETLISDIKELQE